MLSIGEIPSDKLIDSAYEWLNSKGPPARPTTDSEETWYFLVRYSSAIVLTRVMVLLVVLPDLRR